MTTMFVTLPGLLIPNVANPFIIVLLNTTLSYVLSYVMGSSNHLRY
jgi:hypothetical protein